MSIPVLVIGGYLGAGKTTLVNTLLERASEPIGVVVNDFGSIAIDADLIENRDGDTIELANGCICCTLSGGIGDALSALARRARPPSLILVEASGVANPRKIAQYAKAPGFTLDGVVVLVDAESVRKRAGDERIGRDVRRQIASADLLIVHKIDLVDAAQRGELRVWLTKLAPHAPIVEAAYGGVPMPVLIGSGHDGEHAAFELQTGDEDHANLYATWSFSQPHALDREAVSGFLAALPNGVLRGKGTLAFRDDPHTRYVVHVVGQRRTLQPHGAWEAEPLRSRIVLVAAADDRFIDVCDALAARFLV